MLFCFFSFTLPSKHLDKTNSKPCLAGCSYPCLFFVHSIVNIPCNCSCHFPGLGSRVISVFLSTAISNLSHLTEQEMVPLHVHQQQNFLMGRMFRALPQSFFAQEPCGGGDYKSQHATRLFGFLLLPAAAESSRLVWGRYPKRVRERETRINTLAAPPPTFLLAFPF